MRFCPFCSAENADELAVCSACGRRLPPLPPRRARNAPPTGVQLPPRPQTLPPPSPPARKPATVPPPIATPALAPAQAIARESAPALPPPPVDELRNVLAPGPAAQRREPGPAEVRDGGARRTDVPPPTPPPPRAQFDDDFNTQAGAMAYEDPVTTARAIEPAPRRASSTMPPAIPSMTRGTQSAPLPAAIPSITRTTQPGTASGPMPAQPGPRSAPITSPPPPISAQMAVPPAARPPLGAPRISAQITAPAPPVVAPAPPPPRPITTPPVDGPPPTRIQAPMVDRPFAPPKVLPVPEIPEPGLYASARYAVRFGRARWQRRGAIKELGVEIKQDTEALDQVLGALGKVARGAKLEGRVFSAENAAISAVEERIVKLGVEGTEVEARKADENSKFVDVERERNSKLADADKLVEEVQRELATLETQRRNARDKRKELERRQKAYLKAAEDNEKQSSHAQMGDQRQELRRSAEQHRREAAQLEPDRQEIDRRLAGLEKPIAEVTTKLDAAKAELDAAKRSLNDAREGHTHRLAELDAEQKRKSREVAQAEGEIARRLVTLGTLVNLNRIEDPQFDELYQRVDRLRGAITARTTEIEKLAAEREAFDRGTLVRGIAAMGGAVVAFIALIVILRAIL